MAAERGRFVTGRSGPLLAFPGALAACLLGTACGGAAEDAGPESAIVVERGIVRLADLLERAEIVSPLSGVEAAHGLEALGDIPSQTVFEEGFEELDPAALGWPRSARGAVVADEARGAVFRLDGRPGKQLRAWVIEARPSTSYVFERSVRSDVPLFADFEVIEASQALPVQQLLSPARGNDKALLKVHWVPPPEPDGTWQRDSVSFYTLPTTRALVVVLWGTTRRFAQLPEAIPAQERAWFDDLRLALLEPTHEQRVALVKALDLAGNADPDLGMRKRGQFLPLRPPSPGHGPDHGNYSQRYALYAPPPTELAFPLRLAGPAVLRFSYALSEQTRHGAAARFEVLVRAGRTERSLWSRRLDAVAGRWHWHEAVVDLAEHAGEEVTLVMRTSAEQGEPHPVWGNPTVEAPREDASPAHVILIAVDTLRADRLSCYGHDRPTSPRIDALAAEGVRFERVVSNATWTCPSFASIFTGLVPSRHGVWVAGPLMRLPRRFETLAERFRDHGWATRSIAYKAPLYDSGYDQGFDVSFNVPRSLVRADDNLREALEWLEGNADRRGFLFLHFNDPHQPFCHPEPFDDAFAPLPEGVTLPLYVYGKGWRKDLRPTASDLYDGAVAYVDDRIGRFLDALRERGMYDDAVILFVSDHGEELWEHGHFGHSDGRLYDEAVRVPLIVKPARGDAAWRDVRGRVVPTQVRAFDAMPTLLELAGIPVPEGIDAVSLVPLMRPGAGDAPDRLAVTETRGQGLALRTRDWKYILGPWTGERTTASLFDLSADPLERVDVSGAHPELAADLRAQLLDYLMLHRPGRYLVAVSAARSAWVVGGVDAVERVWGRAPISVGPSQVRLEGAGRDPLASLLILQSAGGELVDLATDRRLEPRRYTAGTLAGLLRDGTPGLHLFEGPSSVAEEPDVPDAGLDLQQLDALRDLGYLGADE